jgi:hypothetical protein
MHNGLAGLAVSRLLGTIPPPIFIGPIEIGSKQRQQTSLIGLTNLPEHGTLAFADIGSNRAISTIINCLYLWFRWSLVLILQDLVPKTSLHWGCFIFLYHLIYYAF